jgi:hypothetical protein
MQSAQCNAAASSALQIPSMRIVIPACALSDQRVLQEYSE